MSKISYAIALVASIMLFNSCYNNWVFHQDASYLAVQQPGYEFDNSYGPYLAGRIAHLRKDFNTAADYYSKALENDPNNKELLSRIYIILASKERVDEAAKYAEIAIKNGDKNNFTHIIIAIDKMKKGEYKQANAIISKLQGPVYKEFITPLISAWAFTGEGNSAKALNTLSAIKKEPAFKAMYSFHAGMINDYFGKNAEAQKNYEVIIKEESLEMSFRSLQIITNFYIRTDQKEKALELAAKYGNDQLFKDMLKKLQDNIKEAEPQKTEKLIKTPNDGLAEALFNIAATLRQGEAGVDIAHVFTCLAIYANPHYDLVKLLLADILEKRDMYEDAIEVYNQIEPDSEAYFSASVKKAGNLVMLKRYAEAEKILKNLTKNFPKNPQLYLDLGDVLRIRGKFGEAIKNYKLAVKNLNKIENQNWILLYTLAIAYEQDGQNDKAEKYFIRAKELSQNHFLVLNYLGYIWIKQGKNVEDAFSLIVDAYNQAPHDGNIADSLGWAFYRLGLYDEAIAYLEKASELEPASAIIYDHLGDAYWKIGRKNEAVFQWKHSLIMKDDSGEVNKETVEKKIEEGLKTTAPLKYNEDLIKEKIKTIYKD